MSKSKDLPPIEDLLEGIGLDETALATYTARFMRQAVDIDFCDDILLNTDQEDFENRNKEMFDRLLFRRELKNFLCKRGIFTEKNNGRISHQFFETLIIEEP
ncbi:hypothetical protein GcM1_185016 [Golovinomyces cichoracearum]|uniref:Uncharacterized protein n=1 Tax=Golovinomyces cichoracearum TaxID=62708 RepID=A0A420J393_9PEZI|nr:hypothetical protein GcM1_185016 [Golovinomyces cichoracearum]